MGEGRKSKREVRKVKKHILLENLTLRFPGGLPGSPRLPQAPQQELTIELLELLL